MGRVPVIALMTDFGLKDPFTGIMKAVIVSLNPSATIIDVCHGIEPGDIRGAAFALRMAFLYFPEGTIFVVVVDPGVGTERKAIAAEIEERIVVAPDNGVLSWVLKEHSARLAVELANPKFFLPRGSATFHARDVFAPVAGHLSKGVPLTDFGPTVDNPAAFPIPEVFEDTQLLRGEVVYIDRFGNLITNIGRQGFEGWRQECSAEQITVCAGSSEIQGLHETYGAVSPGCSVAVFGSADLLEIAVNQGNAADSLGATVGTSVSLHRAPACG